MRVIGALIALTATAATAAVSAPGVENPQRAHLNWMLHCQGCHRPDATGTPPGTPAMAGDVALFLQVEGGREYLTRVPGVANAALPDDQLAELLNWTLSTFDGAHLPADFTPYSAEELSAGRKRPFVSEATQIRAALREKFPADVKTGNAQEGSGE